MKCTVRSVFLDTVALVLATAPSILAAQSGSLEDRLNVLEAQNQQLREELATQKQTIRSLESRLGTQPGAADQIASDAALASGLKFGRLHISGEGGVGYFHTGSDGQHPDGS